MRKLTSAIVFCAIIAIASSFTGVEAEEADIVLGHLDGTLIATVNEVGGMISSGNWDLKADFNNQGPQFTNPDRFTSTGIVNSNLTVSNAIWQILDGSGDVLHWGSLDFPTDLINHVVSGAGLGPVTGEISLNSSYFPNLVLSYAGKISEASGGYSIAFNGILKYTPGQPDDDPDTPEDDESGGTGGCFISGIKAFMG